MLLGKKFSVKLKIMMPLFSLPYRTPRTLQSGCLTSHRCHHVFVMACDVLVFFRWSAEALGAEIAAMWVILGVDGDDVSLKARGVSCTVIAILTLIHPALPVHFGQNLFPSVSTQDKCLLQAFFVREWRLLLRFFGVARQDVAAEHERICDPKAAVATLVQFFGLVSG